MIDFVARRCAVAELDEVDAFVIALYDDPDHPAEWLEIQMSLEFDDQDEELGLDGYCVCTSDEATHYGGIRSCSLDRDVLELQLSEDAARVLGFDQLTVHPNLPEPDRIAPRDRLERILREDRARPEKRSLE